MTGPTEWSPRSCRGVDVSSRVIIRASHYAESIGLSLSLTGEKQMSGSEWQLVLGLLSGRVRGLCKLQVDVHRLKV